MSPENLRLADGAPVWEGAAVKHFADDGGRIYALALGADGVVYLSGSPNAWAPGASLRLDLTHRPTFLELAVRVVQASEDYLHADAEGMWEFRDGIGDLVLVASVQNPAPLLALWLEVDR